MHVPKPPVVRGQIASIGDVRLEAPKERISLDETLNISLSFKLLGYLRNSFVQTAWEEAHNLHDTVMRMRYFVGLDKIVGGLFRRKIIKPITVARTAKFYWSRNPELPHRIWVMIVNEDNVPLLPKSEDEAKSMFFDLTKIFSIIGTDIGRGTHSISARIRVKWGRHSFVEHGTVEKFSEPIKVVCR